MERPPIEEYLEAETDDYTLQMLLVTLKGRIGELGRYALDLEARLKEAEGILKSTLNKLYRLDFMKGSRLSLLIEGPEEALEGIGEDKP